MTRSHRNNFTVIIQGPLTSVGTTFGNFHLPVTSRQVINFDCEKTILNNVRKINSCGAQVIICLWSSEDVVRIRRIRTQNPRAKVIVLEAPDTPTAPISDTSKFLQFYSTLHGLQAAEKMGFRFAFKIRTDQEIDLQSIFDLTEEIQAKSLDKKFIVVPFMQKTDPFFFLDFYFGGRVDTMLQFCSLFLSRGQMSLYPNVHQDAFLKLALTLLPEFDTKLPVAMFSDVRPPFLEIHADIAIRLWTNCLIPGTRKAYISLLWRGRGPDMEIDYGGYQNLIFADTSMTPETDASAGYFVREWVGRQPRLKRRPRWFSGEVCWYRFLTAKWGYWPGLVAGGLLDAPFALRMFVHRTFLKPTENNSQRQKWIAGKRVSFRKYFSSRSAK